ncbi:MAG TPA: DUF1573 domain-containing protein [Cyclobacteriaceae bacterium]|nr:DUF1573 domain-containing protein [Cyclobacteriaceae bacterium]HNP07657.1 DUF1573 domain-containing protein [Cyclobacteriaceae bacterium]HRK53649.1 DUF1573 domain-containing protein [Cyclobacteriaceae bacterium]
MKKLGILVVMFFLSAACFAQVAATKGNDAGASNMAVFGWESAVHDFGKIKQGVPVSHEFTFTNTGKTPLVITNVQASCGCTTPAWTKDPIPPGGSGFIKATFNAAAMGGFNKTITVMANVENGFKQLSIKGEVTQE